MSNRNPYRCTVIFLVVYSAVFVAVTWYLSSERRGKDISRGRFQSGESWSAPVTAHIQQLQSSASRSENKDKKRLPLQRDAASLDHTHTLSSGTRQNRRDSPEPETESAVRLKGESLPKRPNTDVIVKPEKGSRKTAKQTANSETDFQAVHAGRSMFVYSAHYDDVHNPPVVTVVAIVNRSEQYKWDKRRVDCLYDWTGDDRDVGQGQVNVTGKVDILPDHHGAAFGPAFIYCKLEEAARKRRPETVSVSLDSKNNPLNTLKIHYPQPRQFTFLLCFSPLHGKFNDATLIVQNLELAQILGAEHAVVYSNSIGPGADKVLKYYVDKGFLEIKGWRQPPEPIHYKGQIGAINDCLLLSRNRSDFVVFMDFDEMIVPRFRDTWSEFIEDVYAKFQSSKNALDKGVVVMSKSLTDELSHPNKPYTHSSKEGIKTLRRPRFKSQVTEVIGAFAFPSSVFLWDKPTNLTSDDLKFANRQHVPFLLKQRRTTQLWPDRSKNIVNPRNVSIMGIHRVARFAQGQRTLLVNETVALLHHYRWYSPGVASVKDACAMRFSRQLVKRMKAALQDLDKFRE